MRIDVVPTPQGPLRCLDGRLVDAGTGALRATWSPVVRASVALPGGRTLLLAAGAGGPRRFDLDAGEELAPVRDPAEVWDVTAAGAVLAGAGPAGLHRWDVVAGTRLGSSSLLGPPLRAITAVPRPGGGITLVACDATTLYRWDAATGASLLPPQPTAATSLTGLAPAPSLRPALLGYDASGAVHRWDID
ncbi:hypothetical protein [Dactylosporangium matsuzakiense]|uniref:hypothetical protein n=1 Tax=Dactylosporangium matsuzakiense TaxID=53360 RepID=UPI0021C336EB|nr:hypothetical protein [Dactylosporangium matsuzakiense]UWZ42038.1 hypothetical protein Dmats_31075 [Dactylosporangium matsuzakiense]